jgi:glycosyltransferase involved in cell wall biosynthesis
VNNQKSLKKVLIVSFYFSPINTIGSLRISKLAKYLQNFGWEPWVITVDHNLYKYTNDLEIEIPENRISRADYGIFSTFFLKRKHKLNSTILNKNIKTTSSIKNTLISKFSNLFQENRFPDRYLPWYVPAYKKGIKLSKEIKFDIILSSFSPPASHIIAYFIAKKYNTPWVADYRDLWTMNHNYQREGFFGSIFNKVEISIEKYFLNKAVSLITVSEPLKKQLETLHNKKVNVITNGYDHEDYIFSDNKIIKNNKIKILYTGNIYNNKQSPELLFLAIDSLISKKILKESDFEIKFYGTNPEFVDMKFAIKFSNSINFFPRISQKECIQKQLSADILLLLQWNDTKVKGFYSGKVFEYLGAKKPILAVGIKGGVISDLLKETSSGYLATNVLETESILTEWVKMYKSEGSIKYTGKIDVINKYTRLSQAKKLASILDESILNIF